jgi:hypothetical protein
MMMFRATLPEPADKPVAATPETEAPAPVPPGTEATQREPDRVPANVTGIAVLAVAMILLWAVVNARIRASAPQYITIVYPGLFGCIDATLLRRIVQLRTENNPE